VKSNDGGSGVDDKHDYVLVWFQASTRFVYDAPCGVKAAMKWLYANVLGDPLEQCSTRQWPALLHAVAFLHVSLRERSTFGPPAWNAPYDCLLSDLTSSVRCLQNHVDSLERSKVNNAVVTSIRRPLDGHWTAYQRSLRS